MDGVPKILDELLKQQSRVNKLLERCKEEKVPEKPLSLYTACRTCNMQSYVLEGVLLGLDKLRDTERIRKYLDELSGKHDEIADIKSAHDSAESIDSKKPGRKDPTIHGNSALLYYYTNYSCYPGFRGMDAHTWGPYLTQDASQKSITIDPHFECDPQSPVKLLH